MQEVTRAVEKAISAPHAAERLMRCWGSGAAAAARGNSKEAKEAVAAIVEEYLGGGEVAEAMRCIRELNLPFFHHEVRTHTHLCSRGTFMHTVMAML